LSLRLPPSAPRRGRPYPIAIAAAVAALCAGAGAAFAAGGGGVAPDGGFSLASAAAKPKSAFFDGVRRPKVTYEFSGPAALDVTVQVTDRETGELVDSFVDPAAQPNVVNAAVWDGRTADGKAAPNGEYAFRVGTGGVTETTPEAGFAFHKYRFPLPAKHSYGDGFGADRDHEGQDVFAKCGKKLLAVRGGRVQENDVHAAAGNYVVIDGKGTRLDFMYGHMLRPSPLAEGARVRTGQLVGQVGQSGNASGCHLHFELWSAPGYYEGGQAMASVGSFLETLDAWS
jgi:murein DD-endopeptidase MepM/ murein hydrolase activator NlpD